LNKSKFYSLYIGGSFSPSNVLTPRCFVSGLICAFHALAQQTIPGWL